MSSGGAISSDAIEAQLTAALASSAAQVQAAVIQAQAQLQAAIDSSTIRANADIQAATITGTDHIQATSAMANAEVTAAQIRSSTDYGVAQIQVQNQIAVAQIQASYEAQVATINHQNDIPVAQLNNSTQVNVANIQVKNQLLVAQTQAGADESVAATRASADIAVANTNSLSSKYTADQRLIGDEYVANTNATSALAVKDIDFEMFNTKFNWMVAKFEQIWPYAQTILGANGNVDPGAAYTQMLATVGTPPSFVPTSVYTEQQIQQQLNLSYSRILQSVQSKIRSAEIDLAGRGFSSSSPILNAITMGYNGYGIMASADEEVKIRLGSATANADQVLKSQTEAIQYYEQNLAAYTALEKTLADLYTGMLGSAAQLVSAG